MDLDNKTIEYQKEFIYLISEIQKRQEDYDRSTKIRISRWVRKFAEVCGNLEWERNRNLHSIMLLDCMLNNHFIDPYDKHPKDEHLPIINKSYVKSKVSRKFLEFVGLIHLKEGIKTSCFESNSFNEKVKNVDYINKYELNSGVNLNNTISNRETYNMKLNNSVSTNTIKGKNKNSTEFNTSGVIMSPLPNKNQSLDSVDEFDRSLYSKSVLKRIENYNNSYGQYLPDKSKLTNFRENYYDNSRHLPNNIYISDITYDEEIEKLKQISESYKKKISVRIYLLLGKKYNNRKSRSDKSNFKERNR